MADAHYARGDSEIAKKTRRQALALDRQLFGARHPRVAVDLNNLGDMQMDGAKYPAAEALYRQALAINRDWYGEAHQKVGENLLGLATSLIEQKRYDEASEAFDKALFAMGASVGEQSPSYAEVLGLMGDGTNSQAVRQSRRFI